MIENLIRIALVMNRLLAFYYLVLVILYALGGNWGKAMYWGGAMVLTLGVSLQK